MTAVGSGVLAVFNVLEFAAAIDAYIEYGRDAIRIDLFLYLVVAAPLTVMVVFLVVLARSRGIAIPRFRVVVANLVLATLLLAQVSPSGAIDLLH